MLTKRSWTYNHTAPLTATALHGSFFALKDETVRLTVKSETGAIVSSKLLWKEAQTGTREWSAEIMQWSAVERPTLIFNKVK